MRLIRFLAPLLLLLAAVLPSPTAAQSGSFGNSVIINSDEMIIAEPTTHFRPGTVYVYRNQGGEWQETDQLRAENPERADGFGTVLALAQGTLFVAQRAGPIHTFERDGDGWRYSGPVEGTDGIGMQPPEEDEGEWGDVATIPLGCNQYGYCETDFGVTVAADGDWLFVGEPGVGDDDGAGGHQAPITGAAEPGAGAIHTFRRGADGTWTSEGLLQPADAVEGDLFGKSIALADGRALVGAPERDGDEGGPVERAGRVYEFVLEGGEWIEMGIVGSGQERNASFGASLAMAGDRAVIGEPGSGDGHGAAYVYQRDDSSGLWEEAGRLTAFSSVRGDRFGNAVALAGHDVWVGAPAPRDIATGRVYLFRGDSDELPLAGTERIQLTETVEQDAFGSRLVAGDGVVTVSALGMHHGAGSVHVYEQDGGGAWNQGQMLVSPPDAHEALLEQERECAEHDGQIGPFECDEVDLVAFVPNSMLAPEGRERGVRLNDNWGWTDPETGREYALVGRNDGLAILDISDPVNPFLVGDLPKTPDTPRSQLWRDMKVYQDHVFVVADGAGNHGMQVLDLTRIRDLDRSEMPVTFEPDHHYTDVASVHNININEETGFAALVGGGGGGESCGGGLHMLDVRDPLNPVFLGCHLDERGTHDVQCATYRGPDERYQGRELCLKANVTFLSISDVTDRDNPQVVGRATYPNPGYLHQGWLTEDHHYFIMDDEADVIQGHVETTRTLIFDVSDVEDPVLAREFFGSFPASAHNLYIKGNFTYQANYRYGLHVLDTSDPENPSEVGFFDTTPYLSGPGFSGAWSNYPYFESGLVLVTSVQDGMFLLRPRAAEPVFE